MSESKSLFEFRPIHADGAGCAPDHARMVAGRGNAGPGTPLREHGLCACGCGEEVNPRVGLARDLRSQGFPFSKIGEQLGCSVAYIKALLSNPPKWVKGHNGRMNWGFGECSSCGKRFAKKGPNQTVCNNNRTCASARQEVNWAKWAAYDEEISARRERREALVRERRDLRWLLQGRISFGSEAFREQKLAEVQGEIDALSDELHELIEAQRKEERSHWAGSRWVHSLDASWRGDEDSLYEYQRVEDAVALAFESWGNGCASNAWTDVVHAIVDRRREIDEWADAA